MALSTYNELVAAIRDWSERSDLPDTRVQEFIYFVEIEAFQQLRVPAMEHQVLLTSTNGYVTIPFDFIELRRLTWEGTNETTLQYLPWDQFVAVNTDPSATPMYYSRQGANWFISGDPGDGSNILCHYYRLMPALGTDQQTTWLLTVAPQVYLFGALKYAYEYTMDQDRAAYWGQRMDKELNKLQAISDLSEHRGSSLSVKTI